ncbi:MAG: hypothetical protein HRU15_18100 [Planctomycetes bacterium]|nr:hypothetical protein [Planctomycetota bacterium]
MMWEDTPDDLNDLPPDERDRILDEIIEQVIKPQLESMSDMFPDAQGEAFVFGGHDEVQAKETLERIQSLMQDGLTMDYIISEMSDLNLQQSIAKNIGDMKINFINIDESAKPDDIQNLTADELEDMFDL